jgi:plastocyanin
MSRSTGPVRRVAALVLTLGAVLLSGCSSDEGAATGAAPTSSSESSPAPAPSGSATPESSAPADAQGDTVAVAAQDFSFELDSDSLAAGEQTFELTNKGSASHDLVVERDGEDVAKTEIVGPGQTASVTTALEPGEYVIYCSVGNHRAMGMEVTVTVS